MLLQPYNSYATKSSEIDTSFQNDVLEGLAQKVKTIPPRWFYDLAGSALFEKITALPEYYLTRAELQILSKTSHEIASLISSGRTVVEFGSGSSTKTPLLLSAVNPSAYVPVDISGDFLRASTDMLRARFSQFPIYELEADFTQPFALPDQIKNLAKIGFFPGSTIGNFQIAEAVDLLRMMNQMLGEDSMLLIGVDRVKDRDTLIAAYDDPQGITASFNKNILVRINRELRGSIPIDTFNHQIRWNEYESRIEMHLEAQHDVRFSVAGYHFQMKEGETIHTENSLKYGIREARLLLRAGGWAPIADWTDEQESFSLILAEASHSMP